MTQWGLDNLFNPGKRHMDDEKRRLQSTREEIGDSSGGRRIDLEAGKVSISLPRSRAAAPETTDDDTTDAPTDAPTGDSTDALAPALEAEDLPTVALASDEAEIEPEVVEDPAVTAPVSDDAGPTPEPQATPPARRRAVTANHWARRG